jgi:hypothetical protein
MIETKEKQIGGRGYVYRVTQFGAKKGNQVMVRLAKVIGKMVGGDLEQIVTNLVDAIDETQLDFFCDAFASMTEVAGGDFKGAVKLSSEGVFDLHFAGEYKEMGQWLLFAIETNYASFLPEGGLASLIKKAAPQVSELSTDSNNSSVR